MFHYSVQIADLNLASDRAVQRLGPQYDRRGGARERSNEAKRPLSDCVHLHLPPAPQHQVSRIHRNTSHAQTCAHLTEYRRRPDTAGPAGRFAVGGVGRGWGFGRVTLHQYAINGQL